MISENNELSITEQLEEKYPGYIIANVRNRIGDDENDTSVDEMILKMTPNQVFSHVTKWNGLLGGYDETIKGWVRSIYGIDLDEVGELK